MLPHQDWNRIVIHANDKPKRGERAMAEAMRKGGQVDAVRRNTGNTQHAGPSNMRRLAEETDVVQVNSLSHDFRMAMQKARVAAGLSQADLARRVSEKQSVINEYESGRAIPNPSIISKIERALNCHLPRNKPERRQKEEEDRR